MAAKHPPEPKLSVSGTRKSPNSEAPVTPPLGTNAERDTDADKEIDPSHFGIYEFPPGLREELIAAEKPRLDPKYFQDTVPPNAKAVLTEPVTTPRGGFVAPKPPEGAVDRDAPTVVALPRAKARTPAEATPSAPPASAPPVDISRSQDTITIPGIRQKRKQTRLVVAAVFGAFIVIGVAIGWMSREQPSSDVTGHDASRDAPPVIAPPAVVSPPAVSSPAVVRAPEVESTPTPAPESTPSPGPAPGPSTKTHHAARTSPAPATPGVGSGIIDIPVERTPKPETAPVAPAPSAKRKFPFSAP